MTIQEFIPKVFNGDGSMLIGCVCVGSISVGGVSSTSSRFRDSIFRTQANLVRMALVILCLIGSHGELKSQEKLDSGSSNSPVFDPSDGSQVAALLKPFREVSEKWQDDVSKLASENEGRGGPEHVLFLGSSSFRLWDSLPEDLSTYSVIKRAYGGAKYRDLAIYTPDLIRGLRFRKAVVFIANDITGKDDDTDPVVVGKLARLVVEQLRREQPGAEIYLLAVTPTPSRYAYWPRIQQTNRELRSIAQNLRGVHYIPTSYAFLDADGEPKAEYFVEDKLHLNAAGYRVWAELIKCSLEVSELSDGR